MAIALKYVCQIHQRISVEKYELASPNKHTSCKCVHIEQGVQKSPTLSISGNTNSRKKRPKQKTSFLGNGKIGIGLTFKVILRSSLFFEMGKYIFDPGNEKSRKFFVEIIIR